MPDKVHEKLIQRQINQWSRLRQVLQSEPDRAPVQPLPVLTVSRELGSGCRRLAEIVADRLGLQVYGREIIEHIARDQSLSRELIAQLDERVASQIELWVRGMLDRRIFQHDDFHLELVRAVRTLAAHGGVVFLGRGANFILEEKVDLRLRLVASETTRADRLAAREGVSEKDARELIRESDAQRTAFVRKVFAAEVGDARHYDLVVNTDRVDCEGLPDLVLFALAQKRGTAAENRG